MIDKKASHVGDNFHILRRDQRSIVFDARALRYRFVSPAGEAAALEELKRERPLALSQEKPAIALNRFRIEVTLACNANCSYCIVYQNDISKEINHNMPMEVAESIVQRYWREIPNGSLMMIGGEPLVNWPVVKYFIEQIPGELYVFTNGTLIDDEKAAVLARPNVNTFVSLDGADESDNALRILKGNGTTFQGAMRGLRNLKKHGARLGISCVLTDRNVKKMSQFVDKFIEEWQPIGIGLSIPHYTSHCASDVDMEEYTQQMIETFRLAKEKKIYIDQISKRVEPILRKELRHHSCKVTGEQITFYPDGHDTLCIKFDDVSPTSVDEMVKNVPINNDFCQGCLAIGTCGGGCPWDAKMRYSHGVDERECVLNPALADMMLWDMYDELALCGSEEGLLEKYRGVAVW